MLLPTTLQLFTPLETLRCVSVSVVCTVPIGGFFRIIYQPKLDQFHVMYVATMTSYYFKISNKGGTLNVENYAFYLAVTFRSK